MARNLEEPDPVNLTPMIDVVFQMIIFFVFTVDLDKQKYDRELKLADTEYMEPVEQTSPGTVYIDVLPEGYAKMHSMVMNDAVLENSLRGAVARSPVAVPVVIRGAANTQHRHIKRVLDIAVKPDVGIQDVRFAGKVPEE